MGKYLITTRKNGEYQFNLRAGNGETVLTSEGYATKSGCKAGIQSVRNNCFDDTRYERIEAITGRWRFNLRASNGRIIGTSKAYESRAGMEGELYR